MGNDEEATVRTLRSRRELFTELVVEHHGRIVNAPGDNILAEFGSVVDAVQCAVEIQQRFRAANEELPSEQRMRFRIGVNLGDVIVEDESIYGDGINVAARLEALAEPGGISVSGIVFEQIKHKLDLICEDLGYHEVKNIADPVRVYRICLQPGGAAATAARPRRRPLLVVGTSIAALSVVAMSVWALWPSGNDEESVIAAPQASESPSLAVLPFDNMSGDPEQEYFSDGITEDLITDLSKVSGLFVIARNSVFTYKDQPIDIRQIGEELGVAFVLEGSVRKADGQVRITAQLIDVATGGHIWAERYDRNLDAVFTVQDEVVREIVTALAVTLADDEEERITQMPTGDLTAYDADKQGWWHYHQLTAEANLQAREMFDRAISLDPGYARPYAGLGFTYYEAWTQQWEEDPLGLDRAFAYAMAALERDEDLAAAHTLLGHVYLWRGDHDAAIEEQTKVLEAAPGDAWAYRDLAETLVFAGRSEEAIDLAKRAMELNPNYDAVFPFTLGFAYVLSGQYEEGIPALAESVALNPALQPGHLLLAAAYHETGRPTEAAMQMSQALESNPTLSLETFGARLPFKDAADLDWMISLTEAGTP
jgi:adenylate cyclase